MDKRKLNKYIKIADAVSQIEIAPYKIHVTDQRCCEKKVKQ